MPRWNALTLVSWMTLAVACNGASEAPEILDAGVDDDGGRNPDARTPIDAGSAVVDAHALDGGHRDATPPDARPPCGPLQTIAADEYADGPPSGHSRLSIREMRAVGDAHQLVGRHVWRWDDAAQRRPVVLRWSPSKGVIWSAEITDPKAPDVGVSRGFVATEVADDGSSYLSFASDSGVALVRLGADGTLRWSTRIEPASDEQSFDDSTVLANAPGGGVIVAGTLDRGGTARDDIYLLSVDPAGSVRWQRLLGGPRDDVATGIETLPGGDTLLLGWTTSFSDRTYEGPFGPRYLEIGWLVRLDGEGEIVSQTAVWLPDRFRPKLSIARPGVDGEVLVGGEVWGEGGLFGFTRSLWLISLDASSVVTGSVLLHHPHSSNAELRAMNRRGASGWLLLANTSSMTWLTLLGPGASVVSHTDLVPRAYAGAVSGDRLWTVLRRACATGDRSVCAEGDQTIVPFDLKGARVHEPRCARTFHHPTEASPAEDPVVRPAAPNTFATEAAAEELSLPVREGGLVVRPVELQEDQVCADEDCRSE